MKTIPNLCASFFLAVFLLACGGSRNAVAVTRGVWQYAPVTVDGDDNEWTAPLFFTDEKCPISYSVTNDESNLYLVMKTADKPTQAKILANGVRLRLAVEGAKQKAATLQFPLARTDSQPMASLTQRGTKHRSAGNTDIYELQSSNGNGLHFRNEEGTGIGVQLRVNPARELVYEVRVPFSVFYKPVLSAADRSKKVDCRISIPGFDKNSVAFTGLVRYRNGQRAATDVRAERAALAQGVEWKRKIPLAVR